MSVRPAAAAPGPWAAAIRFAAGDTGSGGSIGLDAPVGATATGDGSGGALSADCEIVNQRGLHARAAAKFVKTVDRFDAAVKVFSRGQEVSGHSIMGLMMLAAGPGTVIHIVCEGAQARAALDDLCALIADGFHED